MAGVSDGRFEALMRRHRGAIEAYARATCSDRWLAEEAVQETFVRAWKYLHTFGDKGSFEGWLIRICRNVIVDLANRTDRQTDDLGGVAHHTQAPDDSPELYLILGSLPFAQREVLVLCGLLGYDYESAATILGVPVGTVRSRLARARVELAVQLRPAAGEA
jgi:RNA polymerase sigma-70 factor (ECF subfamily)